MQLALATPSDIPTLCDLLAVLFAQEIEFTPDRAAQSRALQQIIDNPSVGHIIVAHDGEQRLGMVSVLYSVSTALGGKVAMLEDMVVAPAQRNRGVGGHLLQYALDFAQQQNCLRVTLLTDGDNAAAQRFYQQHGFQPSTMRPLRLSLPLERRFL